MTGIKNAKSEMLDRVCKLMNCTLEQAPERVAELIKTAQQASELLAGLRIDFGVGEILTPGVRELYKDIAESLVAALPEGDKMTKPTNTEMALDYYKSGVLRKMPQYVPALIEIYRTVRGEIPTGPRVIAKPGEYQAFSNPWGAVHVETPNGKLGVKPKEFEVVEWKENPHIEGAR